MPDIWIFHSHPKITDNGVIMLVVIGLEIQEISQVKPQTIPKWNMFFHYFDHKLYRIDNKKENHVNSGYSEENLTKSSQHDLGFSSRERLLNPNWFK